MRQVDTNNVRGRFGFQRASVTEFCGTVACWARASGLLGQVAVHTDHGPRSQAFSHAGLAWVFSGDRLEADDT